MWHRCNQLVGQTVFPGHFATHYIGHSFHKYQTRYKTFPTALRDGGRLSPCSAKLQHSPGHLVSQEAQTEFATGIMCGVVPHEGESEALEKCMTTICGRSGSELCAGGLGGSAHTCYASSLPRLIADMSGNRAVCALCERNTQESKVQPKCKEQLSHTTR